MIIVSHSAAALKGFLAQTGLNELARTMLLRVVLAFIMHRGRMSCSAAAGSVASEPVHRGELTRFMARPRWQRHDFNKPLMKLLLAKETGRGKFLFLIDATLVSQAGQKTQNTYSTGNRQRRKIKKGCRYNKKKVVFKKVHNFTFGLLITPSGVRIPMQIPHYTQEYCREHGLEHRTTAESAAQMIRTLPLPPRAEVVVIGDTAYDAQVVREACEERGYTWIVPANPERVYEGPKGQRPQLRSRLKDWTSLSLKTIRLRASTGKYARYRRLSKWRVGPKTKPRVYYAYQEKREVRRVGRVLLVFSTMKPNLEKATPDDVKILMTNAVDLSVGEVIDLYSLRWQIELFFKELKSTLGFAQYRFQNFRAVQAWVEMAITTVLFLEYERIKHVQDRRLSVESRRWWEAQRLHGLCHAYRQQCAAAELKYLSDRLRTSGGIARLKRLLSAALPPEYRVAV
jgi:Transposase DDE domain